MISRVLCITINGIAACVSANGETRGSGIKSVNDTQATARDQSVSSPSNRAKQFEQFLPREDLVQVGVIGLDH